MNPKLNVLIIDDEKPARELIKAYLKDYNDVSVIAEGSNGFEGIKLIQQYNPDLIFLDIQMPKVSGLEMLEVIDTPPKVIFTTAFDEFAIKAFELNAIDYLLKPFSRERFDTAIKRVFDLTNHISNDLIKKVIDDKDENTEAKLNRVVVKQGANLEMIPIDEVCYFEASDDFVFIHTKDKRYMKSRTMKYFQSQLDGSQFVRIHRSYIVNVSKIIKLEQYEKDNHIVVIENKIKLRVSKSGLKLLKEVLGM